MVDLKIERPPFFNNNLLSYKSDNSRDWDYFYGKNLGFKSKSLFLSTGNSKILSYECVDNSKIVLVDSDPFIGHLKFSESKKNTLFIISSISKLHYLNNNFNLCTENGSSSIIPSEGIFSEMSKLRRKSVSIILNTSNYIEDNDNTEQILWSVSKDLSYGYLIDKLMNDLYITSSYKEMEKVKNAIGTTIALSIDNKMSDLIKRNGLFDQILEIIDNKYKDNDFSLKDIAYKVGFSIKTIQNILLKYNVKFYSYLQSKRCIEFEYLISINKNYNLEYLAVSAGFKNLSAAKREFNKKHQCTIKNYLVDSK
ncbi:hypothetical protein UA38_20490 [Photobacterium kishitanii]|uniref:AraC family transcriptional regulator n=2 Tax=Photobacterium kishitanii TaxID=318456 RepID=UPI0005D36CC6|nr:AraC family transcriptional regulator [Photobacterium kishitanii]KJG55310.1 hypothetical protein UA38_20490 [Photobacterium kishitanii]KJG58424.1 hypothetical protein UA42_19895 [Photobacterium kishitanii]PSX27887.1 AraC family transcriptional regulator [Photobacterium kishitanii]